jgi:hypothetical protein
MDENNGEIWAKLDAGTEAYYHAVNRSAVPLDRILHNILDAARLRPLVIQSLWSRIDGVRPPDDEIRAFGDRLNGLIAAGGQLKTVQIHTIARDPAESNISPLSNAALNRIAAWVRSRVPVAVDVFYSA